jgi:hypothetical protein
MKKSIAIDFDGVINPYTKGWQGPGVFEDPSQECVAAIKKLHTNYTIIIHTAREQTEFDRIREYLLKHDIEHDEMFEAKGSRSKPIADVYLDDRAVTFNGNWDAAILKIENSSRVCGDKFKFGSIEIEHNRRFEALAEKMLAVKIDATARYGVESWNSLGSKGVFVDINRKFRRVKNFVWEDHNQTTSENIEDTLLDMAAYSLLMIMSLRDKVERDPKDLSTTP